MEKFKVLLFLISIFLVTQLLGLYVGGKFLNLIKSGEVQPIFENPAQPSNSIFMIIYILVITGVFIFVVRYVKGIIRGFEAFAVFFSSLIAFELIIPIDIWILSVGFFLALGLTAWKVLRPSILNQNIAVIFSIAGAGAVLGASLGLVPVLIFVVLLSIYDFISVFVTKHMVYIAKEIVKSPMAFTIAIPSKFGRNMKVIQGSKKSKSKFHVFQLGGGDIAIPLVFSVSVLSSFNLAHALFTTLGSLISLAGLFLYVMKKPGKPLPALPWIASGTILFFIISLFVF